MSYRRIIYTFLIFLLYTPLIIARFPGFFSSGEDHSDKLSNMSASQRIQNEIIIHAIRCTDYAPQIIGKSIKETLRQIAEQKEILPGLTDSEDQLINALVLARIGNRAHALVQINTIRRGNFHNLQEVLKLVWLERPYSPQQLHQACEEIKLLKGNYTKIIALQQLGVLTGSANDCLPSKIRNQQKMRAYADLAVFCLSASLVLFSITCATVLIGQTIHSKIGKTREAISSPALKDSAEESPITHMPSSAPLTIKWRPLRVLLTIVIAEWLSVLLAMTLYQIIKAIGFEATAGLSFVQVCLYIVVLTAVSLVLGTLYDTSSVSNSLKPARILGLVQPSAATFFYGFAGYGLCFLIAPLSAFLTRLIIGTSPLSANPIMKILLNSDPGTLLSLVAITTLLGPLYEEILYRGLLFGGLRDSLGVGGAILLSAGLFTIAHGDPQATISLLGLGIVFAWIYHISKNLWSSVLTHALWNGMVTTLIALVIINN